MIVVDTNVVAYLVIDGPQTPDAESLRRDDRDWRVPPLFFSEWLSILTKYLARGLMDCDDAIKAYRRGTSLVRQDIFQTDRPDIGVFNLHLQSGCTSYDCEFVLLAELLGCKLATADAKIVKAFPDRVRVL